MGNMMYAYVTNPDTAPDRTTSSGTFDPLFGFPNGRKEREFPLTREQMDQANLPLDRRDYCAHQYLEFLTCREKAYPLVVKCDHQLHNYDQCEFEDWVLRMKEYEREKRLLERSKRIKAKLSAEEL